MTLRSAIGPLVVIAIAALFIVVPRSPSYADPSPFDTLQGLGAAPARSASTRGARSASSAMPIIPGRLGPRIGHSLPERQLQDRDQEQAQL